jgi:hypothetical protein
MASRQSLGTEKTYIRAGIEAQDATSTTTGSGLVGSQSKKNLPHRLPVRGCSPTQKLSAELEMQLGCPATRDSLVLSARIELKLFQVHLINPRCDNTVFTF